MELSETLVATRILDFQQPNIVQLEQRLDSRTSSQWQFLQAAHQEIVHLVEPIYTIKEHLPVSQVLQLRRGSCSQRMACLEALARAHRIPSRVHALWINGRFWNRRFPLLAPFIPRQVLLLWPQFFLDGNWVDFDELFGAPETFISSGAAGFTNDSETLFEAVQNTAVDFFGKSKAFQSCGRRGVDLSGWVVGDAGYFGTRDAAFAALGSLDTTLRGQAFEKAFSHCRASKVKLPNRPACP